MGKLVKVAPADWGVAVEAFLANKTPNTRRSYRLALEQFSAAVGKTPDAVTAADVIAWRRSMEMAGGAASTVAQRLAAVSSCFRFLSRPMDARGRALVQANPVDAAERPRVNAYTRSRKVGLPDFQAICATTAGKRDLVALRDRALLLWLVLTARRREEIVSLVGADLEEADGGKLLYRYRGKGGTSRLREVPPPCAAALREYLLEAGRSIAASEHLFQAHARNTPAGAGLQADGVLRMLKRRARQAGVDPSRIGVHGLRHLAAALRRQAGMDVEQIRDFLDHSSLATTSVYLRETNGVEDHGWARVAEILGL